MNHGSADVARSRREESYDIGTLMLTAFTVATLGIYNGEQLDESPRILRRLWRVLTLTKREHWTSLPSS
jgi:hypothetical protein